MVSQNLLLRMQRGTRQRPSEEKDVWDHYLVTRGWFKWMRDKGHTLILIKEAVISEWTDLNDNSTRPKWMRQQQLKPCTCKGKCVFCKNGLTGPHDPLLAASTRRTPRTPHTPRALVTPASSRTSSSRTPRTTPSTASAFHTKPGESRIGFGIGGKNCGMCMKLGKKRLPKGMQRTPENKHLYVNKCTAGCPHPLCISHPVCLDCWPLFNTNHHGGWANVGT